MEVCESKASVSGKRVPGQLRIHNETLYQNTTNKQRNGSRMAFIILDFLIYKLAKAAQLFTLLYQLGPEFKHLAPLFYTSVFHR